VVQKDKRVTHHFYFLFFSLFIYLFIFPSMFLMCTIGMADRFVFFVILKKEKKNAKLSSPHSSLEQRNDGRW
jgi:hypothetical protein